ncbi:GIY-YIG nuclease family protein [Priestia koreensis]|uniref:Endonuclease n=1 Tax=Priestia koreensis TaxID=284581 RepID=A0A0M0KU65_9BACI|nr:GIY-YIG nuclease family protein [Priestia koreensis]KOO42359.1 endonuclease [Priestia koreensis]
METSKHYFYVLKCKDGSFYGGYTNNLEKRVATHNSGKGAKYTKARVPVVLIHSETFDTKSEALRAEIRFKKLTRKQKERYLEEFHVSFD